MSYTPALAFVQVALDWWAGLTLAKTIFFGIGVVAAFFAILLAVLALIGVEHHDAADASLNFDEAGGGGIFTVKPLTGFFLGFGWIGGFALDAGWSVFAATLAGAAAGGAFMAVIVAMFRGILAMRSDGTVRIQDAVGAVGTVYVSLPAGRAPGGQVTVSFQGRQETYAAVPVGDAAIPSGAKIRVREIIDAATVRVEPL
jgi:hypothetical protein